MYEPIKRLSAAIGRIVLSARGAFVLWAVLLVLVWALRAFLFPGTGADDGEQLVHSQNWAWGYGPRNPPLFTWLVIIAQQVFGVTIASVVFVKFALLGGALLLLYRIARRMLDDERLAALAVLAPLGFYYVAWDTVFNFTHTAMLAFGVCLTVQAFLTLAARPDRRRYFFFGIAMGIGALAKYNYFIFLGAFLAATLTDPALRRVILDRRMILAAAAPAAMIAPHAAWLWRQRSMFEEMAWDRFRPTGETVHLTAALSGIWETGVGVVSFLLPLLIFLAILFPRAFTRAGGGATAGRYHRLLVRTFVIAIGATLLGVAVIGIERVRPHYMFPLILFPVYFFARANAAGLSARAANRFAVLIVTLAVIVPVGVGVKYAIDPLRGSKSYFHMPYAAIARQLRAAGFRQGTIVGDRLTYPVAGNLRVHFPESRVINLLDWDYMVWHAKNRVPIFPPRPDAKSGQCLFVWSPQSTDWRDRFMLKVAKVLLGAKFPPGSAPQRLSVEMPHGRGRVVTLLYRLVPEGSGNCR